MNEDRSREHTVRSIARLRDEHHESASRLQRFLALLTGWLARPRSLVILTLGVILWICLNLMLAAWGRNSLNPPSIFIDV
jgi:uncharacterized membrane protein